MKYFNNWRAYAEEICKALKEKFPDVKVYVFGSVVKGNYVPSISDIDILIVTDYVKDVEGMVRTALYVKEKVFNMEANPFEFHFSTTSLYKDWYEKMIDNSVRIC